MTSLTAPMRTMNKRPSTQRKKPSRLSLSELNGLHDGWLSLTGKWRLYFGKRCDSGGASHLQVYLPSCAISMAELYPRGDRKLRGLTPRLDAHRTGGVKGDKWDTNWLRESLPT